MDGRRLLMLITFITASAFVRKIRPIHRHHVAVMSMMRAQQLDCDADGIRRAAEVLKAGGLVAFPTETVYGLGANALNDASVKQIFAAKKRPATDPLIVHVMSKDDIYPLFAFESVGSNGKGKAQVVCELLADAFWPGPLTIIFKAQAVVPLSVTSGTGFVGLRSPRHPVARRLLEACGLPVAAPSANRFGHVSPTSSAHVMHDLGDEDIAVLKDDVALSGGCAVGIESTVCRVSPSGDVVSILRCGAVTSKDIDAALRRRADTVAAGAAPQPGDESIWAGLLANVTVVIENEKALIKNPLPGSPSSSSSSSSSGATSDGHGECEGAVAPGQMIRHYAPDVETFVVKAAAPSSSSLGAAAAVRATLQLTAPDPLAPPEGTSVRCRLRSTACLPSHRTPAVRLLCVCRAWGWSGVPAVTISEAFVIDFGGRLRHLRTACSVYCDLSPGAVPEEACTRLFQVLRQSEDAAADRPVEVRVVSGPRLDHPYWPHLTYLSLPWWSRYVLWVDHACRVTQ